MLGTKVAGGGDVTNGRPVVGPRVGQVKLGGVLGGGDVTNGRLVVVPCGGKVKTGRV